MLIRSLPEEGDMADRRVSNRRFGLDEIRVSYESDENKADLRQVPRVSEVVHWIRDLLDGYQHLFNGVFDQWGTVEEEAAWDHLRLLALDLGDETFDAIFNCVVKEWVREQGFTDKGLMRFLRGDIAGMTSEQVH